MQSNLSCWKLKVECYVNRYDVLYESHGNHKEKTYNRDTRNKEKGIKAYHYRKSLVHKEREQMRNKETRELQNNQKTMNNKALVSLHL